MLRRNEILLNLQAALARKIPIAKVLVDDIFTMDVKKAPFLVVRPADTEITSTASDTWKHVMSVELEILAPNKDIVDQILEEVLLELEVFQAASKMVKGVKMDKVEIATTPLFSLTLEMDILFFTPSYRS
ncbi:hypothetical protein [Helicobacter felis]|uniref:hypothetical protein n=1 Tax=Helicobacter felis TaxID=214 RepID=UPI000CEF452E|nr:hypothetical protein [Helicobacter felis]